MKYIQLELSNLIGRFERTMVEKLYMFLGWVYSYVATITSAM